MKKILILAMIMLLTLSGCSKKENPPAVSSSPSASPEAPGENVQTDGLNQTVEKVLEKYDLPDFVTINEQELNDLYSIDSDLTDDFAVYKPMMNVHATEIIVVKAKEGNFEKVKAAVDAYIDVQEDIWSRYLPEQYELVQNRQSGEIGNIYYVIIAEEAESIAADLKEVLK